MDSAVLSHQPVKEFFLARQPILDREQCLYAYELLFRRAVFGPADVTDDLEATASVMAHAAELGMENVIGTSLGFVNIDAVVLMSDFIRFLPHDKIVLEILETVQVTPEILARVTELVAAGFTFALDDVVALSDDIQALLPLVEIIKIDIMATKEENLATLSHHFKQHGKKLLAEKVESLQEFQHCLDLGFDFFQGYYFAKPVVLTGKKLSPSQLAIMHLMSLIIADADIPLIESAIKHDASLGLGLLRLVNTPGIGGGQRIDSIGQALVGMGRLQLQRWLQILLYADPAKSRNLMLSPLLMLATTRGKLLELMAQKLQPGNRSVADKAFTVGIMSLMDTLFALPMDKILEQMPVAEEVANALLYRKGNFGDMLKLAEYIERIESAAPLLVPTLKKLHLSIEELNALQLAAFEWSENVARHTA
jgi:c-di-GMP phosphodiesterase